MIDEMILYTNFRESPLLGSMDPWLRYEGEKKGFRWREELFLESNRPLVYHWIQLLTESAGRYGFRGNLWHCCLTDLLVKGENSYSVACEGRGAIEGTVNAMALHDLTLVHHLMRLDFGERAEGHKVPELLLCMAYVPSAQESGFYNKRICGVLSDLAKIDATGAEFHLLHADCREDAEWVRDEIRAAHPEVGEITITQLGVVIGAHCGPGLLTIFYLCSGRFPE